MRTKQCSGFSCLSSLLRVLRTYSLNLACKLTQASGEGRGRSRCALPLLSLLLFSPFSFASSSATFNVYSCGSGEYSSYSAACSAAVPNGTYSNGECSNSAISANCGESSQTLTCSVPPGTVDTASNSPTSGSGFCDSSDDCQETVMASFTNGQEVFATSGNACLPTSSTASTSSSGLSNNGTSCPSGYSFGDSSGCSCINSSTGDAIPATGADSVPACNGGSTTAPTLSPVAPVDSNGTEVCPSGSDSISNSSGDISCYNTTIPPAVSSGSSGSVPNDGGSGGSSSFHTVPPVTNSQGQTVCPPGSSSISGSNGSDLTCIAQGSASGSGTAPTSSGTSATSSTGSSTAPTSSTSYPSSISMPSLPSASVVSIALGTIGSINETTSDTCPSPVTFDLYGHTFSIPFTYACTLAGKVRPIVIGVFSLASLLLLVK